jgi:hypothetical protein
MELSFYREDLGMGPIFDSDWMCMIAAMYCRTTYICRQAASTAGTQEGTSAAAKKMVQ